MEISIVTPASLDPLPPRLKFEQEALGRISSVKFISPSVGCSGIWSKFRCLEAKTSSSENGVYIIYDFLTLVYLRKLVSRNTIIYECIDDFPYYYVYKIFKNNGSPLSKLAAFMLRSIELKLASKCKAIVVNSLYLEAKFKETLNNKVPVIYIPYSSLLESIGRVNDPKNKISLVYIGTFSKDKGADTCISLFENLTKVYKNIKFYIFGTIIFQIRNDKNIIVSERIGIDDLRGKLKAIMNEEFLYGISLIRSMNYSYKVQEANKDIDYLACGIPIIGNRRKTTMDLIEEGAGVLYDSFNINMLDHEEFKSRVSKRARDIYQQRYSSKETKEKYMNLVSVL